MASIAYGIDGNGKKIYAEDAYSGRTYICPYCFEDINVRKCTDRDDYFAHKSIHNRTPQQIHGTDLVGAVRTVAQGRSLLDPESTTRMLKRLREEAVRKDPLSELTEQERRVLELIGEGLTNREIGARMYLAEKTVKNYVSRVLAKLGMARRTQAAAYAVRLSMDQTG